VNGRTNTSVASVGVARDILKPPMISCDARAYGVHLRIIPSTGSPTANVSQSARLAQVLWKKRWNRNVDGGGNDEDTINRMENRVVEMQDENGCMKGAELQATGCGVVVWARKVDRTRGARRTIVCGRGTWTWHRRG
jgi:hypothetical protein